MNLSLSEWLNLVVRWVHVFAGILWIGQTYLFTWLDGRLSREEVSRGEDTRGAQVWMVHSGGFYIVEKQKTLAVLPQKLHWFRWEAALTWLSGFVLLVIVYYMGGALVDDSVANIRVSTGVTIGIASLLVAWVVYDLMVDSPVGKSEALFATVSFALVTLAAFGLAQVFSGRAAYLHVGAIFGTIMAANVWMRILPAQRRMIRALQEGKAPDFTLAARAKLRSKHNTFLAVPVVFIMLSHHFPTATYGTRYNWVILSTLVLAGWLAAKFVRRA